MAKARLYFDGDNTYIEKEARIYKMVDEIGDKIDNIPGVINNLSSTSETDALSAAMWKELQDQINAMSWNYHFLSSWDCTTGLPWSDPATDPYTYTAWDYYIVSTVASGGGTNYKPHWASYTHGIASTAVETGAVDVNDWYIYDGATWILQPSGWAQIVVDTALSTTSTNPVENRVITQALNNKQNTISNLSTIESWAAAWATALQPWDNITQLTNNAWYQTAGDVAAAIVWKQDVLTAGEGIAINNNVITNTWITCLTGGDDIEVVQVWIHNIPTGYTEIEYISLSGSQYIPTWLSYTSWHTYSVHQRILFSASWNNTKWSWWNAWWAIYVASSIMQNGTIGSNLWPVWDIADVVIEIWSWTSNYSVTTWWITRSDSRANASLSDYAWMNYPLWAMSGTWWTLQSGSNMIGNIYSFSYVDWNDRWEYYPVQRDSDDVLWMYDVVSSTFYPVSWTWAVAWPEAADCTTVNFTNTSWYMLKSSNKLIYATTDTAFNTRDKVCTTTDWNYTPREWDVLALVFNNGCWVGSPRLNIDNSWLHSIVISSTGWANASTLWLGMSKIAWTFVYDWTNRVTWPIKDTTYYAGSGISISSWTVTNTLPWPTIWTTAPASPTEWTMWYDSTNHVLKVYDGSQWVEVGSWGWTYTAGTGIDITSWVISSTVAWFGNLTYDSSANGNLTATTQQAVAFPSTAKVAFFTWTANNSTSGVRYASGQAVLFKNMFLTSFVWWWDSSNYINGQVWYDWSSYIIYTQDSASTNMRISYVVYFYK